MPVAMSIEWKPLRDSHYILASLQPGGGGLRQVFIRQSTLREVQAVARRDPHPVAGLLLGERLDCALTLAPYVLIESHVGVAIPSVDERSVSDAIDTLRGKLGRHSGQVLGWYCSSRSAGAAISRTHATVHEACFGEPWQTVLILGDGGHAGAFFLHDSREARWFHAPFREVTDSKAGSRAPKPTCVSWPAYLTTASVALLAEPPREVPLPPPRAAVTAPVSGPIRHQSVPVTRPVVKARRTPARDAVVAAGRAAMAARRPALDLARTVAAHTGTVWRYATENAARIRAEWVARAAQREAEAAAARAREEERRAREEERQAKEAAERRAAREEAQRRAAEAEKQRAAEAEARRAAEAEARRKAAEEAERRRAAEAEARRQAAEAEARRRAEEAEARRAAEAESRRKATEEAERKAAEAEARRQAAEAEARRKAAEEAERKAAEEAHRKAAAEAQRKAAEEAQQKAAEEQQRRAAEAEAARRQAAEAEARRQAAEAEAQRLAKAEAEAQRLAMEDAEARRQAAEAEARRLAEAEEERIAAEAEARRLAEEEEAEIRRKAAEAQEMARRKAAEAEPLRISVEVSALRERLAGPPVEGSKRDASKVAAARATARMVDTEDTAASDGPYRYLALARREGFELSEKIERGTPEQSETVWLMHERESGLRLIIVTTDDAVREATLHYNLRTEDDSLLRVTAPEHRDLESRTIYGREACLHDLRARCRRLRATGALERDWKVSPAMQLPVPSL